MSFFEFSVPRPFKLPKTHYRLAFVKLRFGFIYDAFLDHLVCAGTKLVLGSSGIHLEIIAGQIVRRMWCISQ
jgi:hypothetical protein